MGIYEEILNRRKKESANSKYQAQKQVVKNIEEDYSKALTNEYVKNGLYSKANIPTRESYADLVTNKNIIKEGGASVKPTTTYNPLDVKSNEKIIKKSQEATKDIKDKLDTEQNTLKYARYLKTQEDVDNEETSLWDKTLGIIPRMAADLASSLSGEKYKYKDENGNTVYLPTYNELKQQKVREDYDTGIGRFLGDFAYNSGKIIGSTALNALAPGVGSAIYWQDMAMDNYKNAVNQGYDSTKSALYSLVNTGFEFATGKLLGGATGKLTGGSAKALDEAASNFALKLTKNPTLSRILGTAFSEGSEEFVQEYLDNLSRLVIFNEDVDLLSPEILGDALYSAAVGAASGGFIEATNGSDVNRNIKLFKDFKEQLEIRKENIKDETEITKIDNVIKNIDEYLKKPFSIDNEVIENTQNNIANLPTSTNETIDIQQEIINRQNTKKQQLYQEQMNQKVAEIQKQVESIRQEQQKQNIPNASTQNMNLQQSAYVYKINPTSQAIQLGQKLFNERGIETRFDENVPAFKDSSVAGLWTKDDNGNRQVILNPKASEKTIVENLAIHELTHDLMSSENSRNALKADKIIDYVKTLDGYAEARKNLEETYASQYNPNSKNFQSLIDEEVVADILGRKLGSQEFINRLVNQKPNIAQRIYDWVKDKIVNRGGKIRDENLFWRNVANRFEKAYKMEYKNSSNKADTRYMMTGKKGAENVAKLDSKNMWLTNLLNKAKKMEASGKYSNEEIRKKTGWFKDKNGDWKFELSDENAKLKLKPEKDGTYKLKNLLEHPNLFKMYPELNKTTVKFKNLKNNSGKFFPLKNQILLSNDLVGKPKSIIGTLLHEIQHYIQSNEEFETGSSMLFGNEQYVNSLGEIEATDTKNRMMLNYEERLKKAPESSKENPIHPNRESILNHKRNTIEKIGEKIYNIFGDESNEEFEGLSKENKKENKKSDDKNSRNGIELDNSSFSYDNQGRTLSKQQQEYFKDSKVRDNEGNLEVVYHQTKNDFTEFKNGFSIRGFKNANFFTNQKPKQILKKLLEGYVKINNPLYLEDTSIQQNIVDDAIAKGYDGIINQNVQGMAGKNEIVTFNSNQFKNIDNENPTEDADIRYSKESKNWDKWVDKNIKSEGTTTKLGSIKLPTKKQPNIPTKHTPKETTKKESKVSMPMAKTDDVVKISNDIAKQINGTGGFDLKQRSWATTSTESDVLKDKIYIEDLDKSAINYVVQSNKKSLDSANRHLDTYGYEKSLDYVKNLMQSDKLPSASDVALMQRMIQEATKKGDYETAQELIMDTAIVGTDLGQATQALSMIQRLTPEGQLKMYTKLVQRAKARGEKSFQNVEITPEMVQNILEAYNKDGTYDQKDLNNRVEKFKQDIADQMKSTTMEKIDAWRYLAMLGNPKTHIRNIVSNIAMNMTIKVKNAMARTLETILPVKERTKTWKQASQEIKDFSKETAENMKGVITGENKYNEKSAIESKKQIFKNKILEKLSNFNGNALEGEDWFFSKRAFQNNLQEYLTANGINTLEDIENNPELVEKAKTYAVEQAEIATFRQYSQLASMINQFERKSKGGKLAIEALMPFKKTPINVAKAGVKYSPLGLIKSITYDAYQLKQGNINASQFIDNLSQGMTGTSLALLGYALAKAGILSGSGDDDKEGKYDSQLGNTGYSVNIGGNSYSISWLSPVAMPLLVGANAYEQLEEDKEWDMNVVSDTLAKTLDPLNEMSFMQGLTNALQSYGSGVDKIKGALESTGQNYVGQFFPTLFSQLAATTDDKKRSTKASNDSKYKFGEQTIRSIMYKVPGLRQQLEVATDIWGNEKEQSDNIIERAFESFIAPYSKTKQIETNLDKEIKRIYNETGENGVIPGIPYAYVKYKDETYRMSANEYTKYKKAYGQTAYNTLNKLVNSNDYKQATDEDKAKMLDNAYDYARAKANQEYFDSNNVDYENDLLDKIDTLNNRYGISADTYFTNKKEYDYAYQYPTKYLVNQQIAAYDKYTTYKDEITNIRNNTTNDKQETIKYINSLNMSIPQKAMFIKQYYKSFKQYDKQIAEYIAKQKLTRKEKEEILTELGFTIKDGRVYY